MADNSGAKLSKPEMRWENNPELALQEAQRMLVTGDNNIRDMASLADVNPSWEEDVLRMHQLIRYHKDYRALPAEIRNMLEKSAEEPEGEAAE